MKSEQKRILITPPGIARYPRLSTPDTKFDKDGVYRVELVLSGAEAEELKTSIDAAMEESRAEALKSKPRAKQADPPYRIHDDEPDSLVFRFKMKAAGVDGNGRPWEQRPRLQDSQRQPITRTIIGQGSRIRVAYAIVPFFTATVGAGVTLRLKGVQVLDLVPYQAELPFNVEDGYRDDDDPDGGKKWEEVA